MLRGALAALLLLAPGIASAQAPSCRIPANIPRPRPVVPPQGAARPHIPVTGYTLALSWSPQFCANAGNQGGSMQCSGALGTFGFILHGLWPEGANNRWPQYCRPAALVPREVIAANLCAMPSVGMIQHEWARHGTCIAAQPQAYFDTARRLYERIRLPDMAALARDQKLTAGRLAQSISARNPGIRPEMIRVRSTRGGWLEEVWLCLDKRFAPVSCPAGKGGMRFSAPLRIRSLR